MSSWSLVTLLCAVALVAVQLSSATPSSTTASVVASVADGDTLTLADGTRVRLLQIDAPEVGSGECYSHASRNALLALAPVGSRVTLEADPALDRVDRFGRLLRYVRRGGLHVNLELVRRGAASPYFYRGDRGRYASRLLEAAIAAKARKRGLWGAYPRTRLDPSRQIDTGRCGSSQRDRRTLVPLAPSGRCDPGYAWACVPPYPPDLDCAEPAGPWARPARPGGGLRSTPARRRRRRRGLRGS